MYAHSYVDVLTYLLYNTSLKKLVNSPSNGRKKASMKKQKSKQAAMLVRHIFFFSMIVISMMRDRFCFFLFAELFHGGEAGSVGADLQYHSYTCPICGKLGFTDSHLQEHVGIEHADSATEVVSRRISSYKIIL